MVGIKESTTCGKYTSSVTMYIMLIFRIDHMLVVGHFHLTVFVAIASGDVIVVMFKYIDFLFRRISTEHPEGGPEVRIFGKLEFSYENAIFKARQRVKNRRGKFIQIRPGAAVDVLYINLLLLYLEMRFAIYHIDIIAIAVTQVSNSARCFRRI